MRHDTDAAIRAIVDEVRTRIPTLKDFAAMSDPGDMGPDVTIPAIWMSLILTHIDGLAGTAKLRELEAVGSLPRRDAPATADDMGDYAGALGSHAVATMDGDRIDAAAVLFQGGVAILMTTLPKEAVLAAMENSVDFFGLRAVLGVGEVRQ